MSGPIDVAKQVCREHCLLVGLCVTVEPSCFIYSGGEEAGFVIGLINYPRFPDSPERISAKARFFASILLQRTAQWSALVMTPDATEWITVRDEGPTNQSATP